MNKLEVKQAFLQTPVSIPHVMAPTTNIGQFTHPGVKLEFWPSVGLLIELGSAYALVPEANVKLALLEKTQNESADKTKSK